MTRILGVDYGERRIGLAVSDPTRTIAQPLPPILRRRGKRPPIARLLRIAQEQEAGSFVVGLPLDLEGEEGPRATEVRRFAQQLQERSGLPVHLRDERMTTVRAARLLRDAGLSEAKQRSKGLADTVAACLILQSYLDATESA